MYIDRMGCYLPLGRTRWLIYFFVLWFMLGGAPTRAGPILELTVTLTLTLEQKLIKGNNLDPLGPDCSDSFLDGLINNEPPWLLASLAWSAGAR